MSNPVPQLDLADIFAEMDDFGKLVFDAAQLRAGSKKLAAIVEQQAGEIEILQKRVAQLEAELEKANGGFEVEPTPATEAA